ncbi:hypothetical protein K505DRAFT_37183 [Melanomma pulvis-pyrius CBS 109.77]|uniref:Uncharacterized protein n=1 Tax=Melanomma pulvis-pyrius CBS 109.77 TaxID=1314802 RepID=A0A6A6XBC1_9PLEO|nr:hypothetical protein K505DRAFT_37183 [Melanomma pulvis-pyrius CBS 109.77]
MLRAYKLGKVQIDAPVLSLSDAIASTQRPVEQVASTHAYIPTILGHFSERSSHCGAFAIRRDSFYFRHPNSGLFNTPGPATEKRFGNENESEYRITPIHYTLYRNSARNTTIPASCSCPAQSRPPSLASIARIEIRILAAQEGQGDPPILLPIIIIIVSPRQPILTVRRILESLMNHERTSTQSVASCHPNANPRVANEIPPAAHFFQSPSRLFLLLCWHSCIGGTGGFTRMEEREGRAAVETFASGV